MEVACIEHVQDSQQASNPDMILFDFAFFRAACLTDEFFPSVMGASQYFRTSELYPCPFLEEVEQIAKMLVHIQASWLVKDFFIVVIFQQGDCLTTSVPVSLEIQACREQRVFNGEDGGQFGRISDNRPVYVRKEGGDIFNFIPFPSLIYRILLMDVFKYFFLNVIIDGFDSAFDKPGRDNRDDCFDHSLKPVKQGIAFYRRLYQVLSSIRNLFADFSYECFQESRIQTSLNLYVQCLVHCLSVFNYSMYMHIIGKRLFAKWNKYEAKMPQPTRTYP